MKMTQSYARITSARVERLCPQTQFPLLMPKIPRGFDSAVGPDASLKSCAGTGFERDAGTDGHELVIFDPSNIRSVNAAFDPKKSTSSTLLAASPFAAVGGAGLTSERELGSKMQRDKKD
jgi:hypothetical protein